MHVYNSCIYIYYIILYNIYICVLYCIHLYTTPYACIYAYIYIHCMIVCMNLNTYEYMWGWNQFNTLNWGYPTIDKGNGHIYQRKILEETVRASNGQPTLI